MASRQDLRTVKARTAQLRDTVAGEMGIATPAMDTYEVAVQA
jgi:hypothetical protein